MVVFAASSPAAAAAATRRAHTARARRRRICGRRSLGVRGAEVATRRDEAAAKGKEISPGGRAGGGGVVGESEGGSEQEDELGASRSSGWNAGMAEETRGFV